MECYVGLDVSLKQTSICVVNHAGSIVQEGVVVSDPEAIVSFVRSKAPGTARIGIETGPTTTWLWTELKRLGLPVICIDARHAKAVLKMQINKSDRNDAAGIARIMQTGWFKEVRVKDLDSHSVRALLASRALLVKIKRDLENQIRGLLKNLGLVIGRPKFNVFAVRAEELIENVPSWWLRSGRCAETLPEDQMLLGLEEVEQAVANEEVAAEAADPAERASRTAKRRINRGSLPTHLPRLEVLVDVEDRICPCCGKPLHRIGDDIGERLDIVPAQFRVLWFAGPDMPAGLARMWWCRRPRRPG